MMTPETTPGARPDADDLMPGLLGQLEKGRAGLEVRRTRRRRVASGLAALAIIIGGVFVLGRSADRPDDVVVAGPSTTASTTPVDSETTGSTTQNLQPFGPGWRKTDSVSAESTPISVWTGTDFLTLNTVNGGNEVSGNLLDPTTGEKRPIAESGLVWRDDPAVAWTGTELVMIGGSNGPGLDQVSVAYNPAEDSWRRLADPPIADPTDGTLGIGGTVGFDGTSMYFWRVGLAYNTEDDSWSDISTSPIADRVNPAVVPVKGVVFVWGGCEQTSGEGNCDDAGTGARADGWFYTAADDSWTEMAPSPLPPATHTVADFVGDELFVFATETLPDSSEPRAAAYNPDDDTWRVIESPDLSSRRYVGSAMIAGQWVVFGGTTGYDDGFTEGLSDGAVYSIESDRWTPLSDIPEDAGRYLFTMVTSGREVLIAGGAGVEPTYLLRLPDPASPVEPAGTLIAGAPVIPPFEGRFGAVVEWTGDEMIVWGGVADEVPTKAFADGWAFNPSTDEWRELAPSPLRGRAYAPSAWTGNELVVFGNQPSTDGDSSASDSPGAAYDPTTDTWRTLSPLPRPPSQSSDVPRMSSVWADGQLIVWFWDQNEVLAYDVALDAWRTLESVPFDLEAAPVDMASIHWTGEAIVVLALQAPARESTSEMATAIYRDEEWTELESVDVGDPFPSNAAVEDGNVYVWSRGGVDDPAFVLPSASFTWLPIPGPPIDACEGHPEPVVLTQADRSQQILVSNPCGEGGAIHDSATREWTALTAPGGGLYWGDAVWTGERVLALTTCCFGTGGQQFENHLVALRWE